MKKLSVVWISKPPRGLSARLHALSFIDAFGLLVRRNPRAVFNAGVEAYRLLCGVASRTAAQVTRGEDFTFIRYGKHEVLVSLDRRMQKWEITSTELVCRELGRLKIA